MFTNALITGPVDTPALTSTTGVVGRAAVVAGAAAHTPVGRAGEPDEVAAFLLVGDARFITGAAPAVDGGLSVWSARLRASTSGGRRTQPPCRLFYVPRG